MIEAHGLVKRCKRYAQMGAPMHEVGALLDAGAVHGGRSARNHLLCLAETNGNGLDPEGILWIRTLMKSLAAEGRTVFVSSHLTSEMEYTADHLLVIGQGRLIADVGMADFLTRGSGQRVSLEQAYMELTADSVQYRATAHVASAKEA